MKYAVGQHVERFDGYRLFGYHWPCEKCNQLVHHETRAVEDDDGRRKEIEVCSGCGRIRKVTG